MRVTKTIREYVEKKVNEAIPLPTTEYDILNKKLQVAEEAMRERIVAYARAQADELRKELNLPDDWKEKKYHSDTYIEFTGFNSKLDIERDEAIAKVRNARAEAIENIIVTLELGGSKTELEQMLSELTK